MLSSLRVSISTKPAFGAEFGCDRGGLVGKFAVRERAVRRSTRPRARRVRRGGRTRPSNIRPGVSMSSTTAAPITSRRTLVSTAGGSTLCWRTTIGCGVAAWIDGEQDVVSAELRAEHRRDAWRRARRPTLRSRRSARVAASAWPVRQRRGARTGMRPTAHSAIPSVTVHGSSTQSPRNSAVNLSPGWR